LRIQIEIVRDVGLHRSCEVGVSLIGCLPDFVQALLPNGGHVLHQVAVGR
jgi:hypothetical protein